MIRSYFILAFRSLFKHKAISLIHITGLALGMAAFLIIAQYVYFELSYDNFHANKANLFRVESRFFKNGIMTDDWPSSSGGYGPAMKREFPEIIDFARIYLWGSERVVSIEDIKHREANVFLADASFPVLLSFPFVNGDAKTALQKPNSVVLSETLARKYFGDRDPMGKIMKVSNTESVYDCMVTGVFKNVPANSHIHFDMLLSWTTLSSRWKELDEFWYQHEAYTYVLLRPGTDLASIEEKFPALSEKYKTAESMRDATWGVKLVPVEDIHLNPLKSYEREVKGSKTVVFVLAGIAALILFIAWINYINLSTTRALERAKEIGIRKTSGARREMLVWQFLLESALVNVLSLGLAIGLVVLVMPFMTELSGVNFQLLPTENAPYYLALLGVFVFGILFSGLYPAMVIASFDPITALKGKVTRQGRGKVMRKSLVVFQFVASMVLIAVSVVVYQQVKYMRNQDKGLKTDQILVLKTPPLTDDYATRMEGLRNELMRIQSVGHVTVSSSVPGREVAMFLSNRRADENTHENRLYEMLRTDHDFIDTYQLEVLHGRNFSRDFKSDEYAVILNEESVKRLGYTDNVSAVGKEIYLEGHDHKFQVIGVVKNFHQTSLKNRFTPIMLFISGDYSWIPVPYISLQATSDNWAATLADIESQWTRIFPESSFDYFFLDEFMDQQYKGDLAFGKLVGIFCTLTIGIACLGLLGLASYDTLLRRKEVGIRKVLGASVPSIMMLLSKDMMKLLLLAYGLALPLAYITSVQWLETYSFRMDLSAWMFLLPLLILFPIALFTVGSQTIKVTLANPVDSLRVE